MDLMLEPVLKFARTGELYWLPFAQTPENSWFAGMSKLPREQLAKDWQQRYRAARDPRLMPDLWITVLTNKKINDFLRGVDRPLLSDVRLEDQQLIVVNLKVHLAMLEALAAKDPPS